jgi:phage-related protein
MKKIIFHGTSLGNLKEFPQDVRREAGYQPDRVQTGLEPDNWKPMVNIGHGVQEIRIRDDGGQFRVIYVAKFADAVHVLHAFQKKTQRTSRADIDLAQKRYDEIKGKL